MTLLFLYLGLALFVSFLCSILEAVILSSTNSYIESLGKEHDEATISKIKSLKANIDEPISSILTLNTFAHTMGAAGVGAQVQVLFGDEYQTVVAFVVTLLILYISEIIPKTIGALYWKKLLIPSVHIISLLVIITLPFTKIAAILTNFISKNRKNQANFSRDEIMAIVAMGEREGAILSKEGDLIENLLKLKNIKARDIMTPRSVVFTLPSSMTIENAVEEDGMYVHSRIPIYDDTIDNVIGVVLSQRILEESNEDNDNTILSDIAHEVHSVSENIPVPNLIDMFIKKKTHLFIVYDSYGQTAGVVTLEDAIETLLGVEIVDEMDEVEDMQLFAKNRSKKLQSKLQLGQKRRLNG